MTPDQGPDRPWRVRIDDRHGTPCGAGVLLDGRSVLTCAHVVQQAEAHPAAGPSAHLRVRSAVAAPEWRRTARVVEDAWAFENGTRRGDVALLRLDEPVDHAGHTELWKVPISGGRVRVYGFPAFEPYGIGVDAELAGSGGRAGEWGLLNRVHEGRPWIQPGYSGAGVMALDGAFAGQVIGIVVADYVDENGRAAWMVPVDTMQTYLGRRIAPHVRGVGIEVPSRGDPAADLDDPLQLALTQELARLLTSGWAGVALVATGRRTGPGSSWLVRLTQTSRAPGPDGGAPRGTALPFGAVDAAYDARGKTAGEVCAYLAHRFGFDPDREREPAPLVHRLLRRRPPAFVIVDGIDGAEDPDRLLRDLLIPLARDARTRGLRLVLGVEGDPPDDLPYQVHLDPTPLPGGAPRPVTEEQAREAVARLARAEAEALRVERTTARRFLAPPRLPHGRAPRLAVRLAVARATFPHAEIAAIAARAAAAVTDADAYVREVRGMDAAHEDLTVRLELYRALAEEHFGAADPELGALFTAADRALRTAPVDLAAAGRRVPRYVAAVNRRIAEG
ncbi:MULTISPECIES: serine protease [unclassified Streptomyces]|uniref:S1 family peptidase n=1 Tax=unclassified Streptomyces TaxID=2593676 RepID=UPI000DBACCF0|nr:MULTISPECIES: serine protease [unclassified Streptomyces]MYT75096.1 trypsin-like serine protease [Streptomyces sp. SID8367]RAJ77053.1 V8-like Glu-specific endopeptidase [Streptomyces sp. PsTaAH-137]